MATAPKTDAEKVAKLREMAKDKSLPQDVRNTYLDQAVKLEEKGAMKAGVKLAKGGAVPKKAAPKKMMYGGAVAKDLPMRGQRTATNMAKGGSVKKGKK
jgi:ribosomal protein S13